MKFLPIIAIVIADLVSACSSVEKSSLDRSTFQAMLVSSGNGPLGSIGNPRPSASPCCQP